MLWKKCSGKMNDECYSILWKAPNGYYDKEINGVQDNERRKFYRINDYNGELVELVRDLNLKERFRSEYYRDIVDSFERTLREAEDRFLEEREKRIKLEEELVKLKKG